MNRREWVVRGTALAAGLASARVGGDVVAADLAVEAPDAHGLRASEEMATAAAGRKGRWCRPSG